MTGVSCQRRAPRGAGALRGRWAQATQDEFDAYFEDGTHDIALPVATQGTAHQERVWKALRHIPAGEVRTYGELAARLKSGARAVGQACGRNPVPLIVPCHRVVSSHGLGGFSFGEEAGSSLAIKTWLLRHEATARSG